MKIEIPWGTYCRIEALAGGLWASDRAFIRAAWSKLNKDAQSKEGRIFRQAFYSALFETRDRIRKQANIFKL